MSFENVKVYVNLFILYDARLYVCCVTFMFWVSKRVNERLVFDIKGSVKCPLYSMIIFWTSYETRHRKIAFVLAWMNSVQDRSFSIIIVIHYVCNEHFHFRKFVTLKWYNSCMQIIQPQTYYSLNTNLPKAHVCTSIADYFVHMNSHIGHFAKWLTSSQITKEFIFCMLRFKNFLY